MARYYTKYNNYTPTQKFATPDLIGGFCTAQEAQELVSYLRSYSGSFNLMTDMRNHITAKNTGLSEKQWAIVRNSYTRDTQHNALRNVLFKPLDVTPMIDVVIGKGTAIKHFKKNLGMDYAVFTLKVKRVVDSVTSRGGNYRKLTLEVVPNVDGTVNVCRMCGKNLTDHKSIVSGIGPYCAKKLGAGIYHTYKTDIQKFMQQFKDEVSKIGSTEITLWDSGLLEGREEVLSFIDTHSQVNTVDLAPKKEGASILTSHTKWLPQSKSFVISPDLTLFDDIEKLYQLVKLKSLDYINVVNPKTGNFVKFVNKDSLRTKITFDRKGLGLSIDPGNAVKCITYITFEPASDDIKTVDNLHITLN